MINRSNDDKAAGHRLLEHAKEVGFESRGRGMFFSVMREAKEPAFSKEDSVAGLNKAKKAFARRVGLINDNDGADSSFYFVSAGSQA